MKSIPFVLCRWAAFVLLLFVSSPTLAEDSRARTRMFVSATVVHACTVRIEHAAPGGPRAAPVAVECGERRGHRDNRSEPRLRLCDASSPEPWCRALLARFPGRQIRVVRFD